MNIQLKTVNITNALLIFICDHSRKSNQFKRKKNKDLNAENEKERMGNNLETGTIQRYRI